MSAKKSDLSKSDKAPVRDDRKKNLQVASDEETSSEQPAPMDGEPAPTVPESAPPYVAPIVPPHISATEAARRLRLHPTTVVAMIRRGELKTIRLGRRNRVIEESLSKFIVIKTNA